MQTFDQKYFNKLKESNIFDGTNIVLVTKWNSFIGASYITTFGNNLFITPYGYGDCVSKTKKFDKNEIKDISVKKSFWTGNKIFITLNNNITIKYALVNAYGIAGANALIKWWLKK